MIRTILFLYELRARRFIGSSRPASYLLGMKYLLLAYLQIAEGEKRNIPVIRVGNVAALPEEPLSPLPVPAYLIETRSLGKRGSCFFQHDSCPPYEGGRTTAIWCDGWLGWSGKAHHDHAICVCWNDLKLAWGRLFKRLCWARGE
jgi:hypothetical protein